MVKNISSLLERNRKHKLAATKLQLERCVSELEYINRHTDNMFYVFEVPRCLFAVPFYDPDHTVMVIQAYLEKQGYDVFCQDYQILINWNTKTRISTILAEQKHQRELKEQSSLESPHSDSSYPQPTFEFLAHLAQ